MRIHAVVASLLAALVSSAVFATTFTVTTNGDANDGACTVSLCTLRDAIAAANTNPGADQINLASGQTYLLTLTPAVLVIQDPVTINGNGSTINANGSGRVFDIPGAFAVTLNNLTLTGGNASGFLSNGGAMLIHDATVVLNGCTITGNQTALEGGSRDDGGGIAVYGSFDAASGTATLAHLTLNGSSVSMNSGSNGGGILCALCALTITNSTISQNAADSMGGGIDMVGNASTLSMTGSALTSNSAVQGGGLAIPFGAGTAVLNDNRIANNVATSGGSAIFNQNAEVLNVNDNWWGCNYGPGITGAGCSAAVNAIQGVATLSSYLVLKVSGAPPTIPLGATSTITADLTMNSLNATTASVPNGTPASFSGTRGTFASPSATTVGGKANDVYTAVGPKGVATIGVTVDGQTVTTSLNVGYPSFTDDPLVPGVTVVKAVHVTELRSMIDNVRLAHGLPGYSWTVLGAGTVIRAQQILDLRTALGQVYTALAMTQPSYTDPTLPAGTVIKAAHISEIRAALIAVE